MRLLLSISILLAFVPCSAQVGLFSGVTTMKNANIHFEYAIGEIATETLSDNNRFVTQGLLQPLYLVSTPANEVFDSQYTFKAYPNPVYDALTIETNYSGFKTLKVLTFSGQQIMEKDFDYETIRLGELPPATYFIHLQSEQYSKIIKIVKQ